MNTVSQVPWNEVMQSFDVIQGVLKQDLVSLAGWEEGRLRARWDSLSATWNKVEDEWTHHLGDNIKKRLRSDLAFARLHLAAVFDDDSNGRTHSAAMGVFKAKEIRQLREFDRRKALDEFSAEDIVQEVNSHKRREFTKMVFGYLGTIDADQDRFLTDATDVRSELVTAFRERNQERQNKVKEAIQQMDPRELAPALWLSPETIEVLKDASVATLISVAPPHQAALLAEVEKVKSLSGQTPDQIAAIGAFSNPQFAEGYGRIIQKFKDNNEIDQYERLVSELKESSQHNREDQSRNMQVMYDMFVKALDSMRDTATAFAGQPQVEG